MEKDRSQRYQQVAEVRAQLELHKQSAEKKQWREAGLRLRRRLAVAGITAVLITGAAYWLFHPAPLPHVENYTRLTDDGLQRAGSLGGIAAGQSHLYLAGGDVFEAYSVSTRGGELVRLATPFINSEIFDLSRDGSKLLIAHFTSGLGLWPLWSVGLPAGAVTRVGNIDATGAAWSPTGLEIAYVLNKDLFRADQDGARSKKLLTLPESGYWLHWSPDGRRLRLTLGDPVDRVGPSHIREVSTDGNGLHPVFPQWNEPAGECCGSWSPDGKFFVFQATREGKTEIYAVSEEPAAD